MDWLHDESVQHFQYSSSSTLKKTRRSFALWSFKSHFLHKNINKLLIRPPFCFCLSTGSKGRWRHQKKNCIQSWDRPRWNPMTSRSRGSPGERPAGRFRVLEWNSGGTFQQCVLCIKLIQPSPKGRRPEAFGGGVTSHLVAVAMSCAVGPQVSPYRGACK